MTFPHTLQERKGPFTCPRCGTVSIRWAVRIVGREPTRSTYLEHDMEVPKCTWLDEATDEQVEALK